MVSYVSGGNYRYCVYNKIIDFNREPMMMLKVFKGNGKSSCRFRKHLINKTSYIKLKRVNSDLNIFEIDINSFYPAE
jgi:hypothetical protein